MNRDGYHNTRNLSTQCYSALPHHSLFRHYRIELSGTNHLPTHHIAPTVDLERNAVGADLEKTGLVKEELYGEFTPPKGDFDHGDVALASGSVFIANTAAGTVEVVDGEGLRHLATIPGCPEASGVLAAQEAGLVFAAARGAGKLLVIDAVFMNVLREVAVGSRPNGLAWDPRRKRLLMADVQDNTARLVGPQAGQVIATAVLPGRPRWAVYHQSGDRFLVNIREPAVVAVLSASTFELVGQFPVSGVGPHGLDLDQEGHRAFVACDGVRS